MVGKMVPCGPRYGHPALDTLRQGVEDAITALGRGFLAHQANAALRQKLRDGAQKGGLDTQEYYRQVLRLVYRLLFLFAAEDRGLLLLPSADEKIREKYARFYSTARLRHLAERHRGTRHCDLYQGLAVVMEKLGTPGGCSELGLPALGSFLWSDRAMPDLSHRPLERAEVSACRIANADFLEAVRALAFTVDGNVLRAVDYKNLGAEELGSVYESLLELHPKINSDAATFELDVAAGHERKTTGSYYTPTSLINCLLDSALDPVLNEAAKKPTANEAEAAILNLKICDPACGSGHFLIAAAHRIAKRLAAVRTGDEEPAPEAYRKALRDVIGHCIFGVDINPMAVELCKINLWLESLEPGKPLSFLDHHIRVGNSLLGVAPDLIAQGIPDDAFKAIEGDDKKACTALKKRNKMQRAGFGPLFAQEDAQIQSRLQQAAAALEDLPDARFEDIRRKEIAFRQREQTDEFRRKTLLADAWCAAFVIRKDFREPGRESTARGLTQGHQNDLVDGRPLPAELATEIERLSCQYQFFHWHLAFPEVFAPGGFDCVLSNPPWERVKLQEKEWFAERSPEIANAPNAAARKRLIEALKAGDPGLYQQFLDDSRRAEGESHLMRNSGRYPLCGRGDINVYAVFAEGMRNLLGPAGRVGCVLPSGIATDDTTKFFFQDVVERKSLASLFDFENKGIFPGVHSSYKFCLFTSGRGTRPTAEAAEFVFFAHAVEELRHQERRYTLSAEDIARLNPDTRTCPTFRSGRDAELTKAVYRRTTVVGADTSSGGWGVDYLLKLVDPTIHRDLLVMEPEALSFRTGEEGAENPRGQVVPLYEGKQIHHFDHRYATFDGDDECRVTLPDDKLEAGFSVMPRYWLRAADFKARLQGRPVHYHAFLSVRDITNVTNERTVVTAIRPFVPALNSLGNLFCCSAPDAIFLCGCLNSYAADYIARQKVGGTHLSPFYLMQLSGYLAQQCRQS